MKLTSYSRFAGCGAKLGPGILDQALCGLSQRKFPGLLADFSRSEDAGVLRLDDERALVHTVDFFPPIVDDPFTFGRIAAANAVSDVYAMGGSPSTAVCLVGFPVETLEMGILVKMMEGGLSALDDADCPLVGGHSIDDAEPKLGYAVTGIVHPARVWLNNTITGGERIILTKPIGTGLITTAAKAGVASPEALAAACESMGALNRRACEVLRDFPLSACTDVTGFGLLGHACEMAAGSPCNIRIDWRTVPLLPSARDYAVMKKVPGGTKRNRSFRLKFITGERTADEDLVNILFDPQTSGGLLAAVKSGEAESALAALRAAGVPAAIIGETVPGTGLIELT
ncbi:MAG: selenide, water dikinase SelD [Spirochaetia bacterium]|jgi:selenide,water dikinase